MISRERTNLRSNWKHIVAGVVLSVALTSAAEAQVQSRTAVLGGTAFLLASVTAPSSVTSAPDGAEPDARTATRSATVQPDQALPAVTAARSGRGTSVGISVVIDGPPQPLKVLSVPTGDDSVRALLARTVTPATRIVYYGLGTT